MRSVIDDNIITSAETRTSLMNRIDVLEKVKHVVTLPATDWMTTRQVADFYDVESKAIYRCFQRHKEEIYKNGAAYIRPNLKTSTFDIYEDSDAQKPIEREFSRWEQPVPFAKVRGGLYHVEGLAENAVISARGTAIFSIRAVLNIGMLLTDSEIAHEVRTQLLNTWEHSDEKAKTTEINDETNILNNIARAYATGDLQKFAFATMEYDNYLKKNIFRLETELDHKGIELADTKSALDKMTTENELLIGKIKTWGERSIVNALIRAVGNRWNGAFARAWSEFYRRLSYRYNIDPRRRRGKKNCSAMEKIYPEEWQWCIDTAVSMCDENGIDIAKVVNDINAENIEKATATTKA